MNSGKEVEVIRASTVQFVGRGGAEGGVAEIGWAVRNADGAPLPAGFGRWHEAAGEPKTLDYDEVLLILEGTFGVRIDDQRTVEGKAGDVIVIPRATTVTYFGTHAKIFFVVTPR